MCHIAIGTLRPRTTAISRHRRRPLVIGRGVATRKTGDRKRSAAPFKIGYRLAKAERGTRRSFNGGSTSWARRGN